MALHIPSNFTIPNPTSSFHKTPFFVLHRKRAPEIAATATATATIANARWKPKEVVLGTPAVRIEKGKYSYEVSTLIDKLSSLPPRGSIARCLESFKNRLSLPDFALVFKEFARRGDWQRSLRLFKYMQRQPWCRPDEHIHALVIGVLGREALLDRCIEIFDQDMVSNCVPRTALSYTALINAFARNGDHETALQLLDKMKSEDRVMPTVLTYNTALHACARAVEAVNWDPILGLFAQMRHDGVRPDLTTYKTLIAACSARGLASEAEMVFRTMNEAGVTPDTTTHTYLVDTFARVGRLGGVNVLLKEMEDEGNTPDATAYNVLLEAYARTGASSEAISVLRQMQNAGCAPNAATYSILLGLYGQSGRYEDVRELFLEMKVGNTAPDASTYNILIRVFGEGGYFKEVVTLFHDMLEEKVVPNMETYEGLVFACGRGGLHEDARKILSYMNGQGLVPSSKTYDGVLEAYGHTALYEEALVAFNTMYEVQSMPTVETYNILLNTFAMGGLFKESQVSLLRMSESGVQRNTSTYNALIESYCQAGQFEEALKAYVDMQKSRCEPDERTLEAILNVYCTVGLVEESIEQFQEIKSLRLMPSVIAYCMLLSVYAKNDRWEDAYQLIDEMKTNRSSNIHQVIGSMIQGDYDDESNWQMVEYAFDNFKSSGCGFGLRLYNALLDALWWLGQKARASRVLAEATKHGLYPELYRKSKLVWSADVHRMSVGGALTAISVWLKNILEMFENGDDLPNLASVVVLRGEIEKSKTTRTSPVSKAVYTFLKDGISQSFNFPGWNKARIVCQRNHLKRLLTSKPEQSEYLTMKELFCITDATFPSPGTKLYTKLKDSEETDSDEEVSQSDILNPKVQTS